jgi:polyhydroxybutyrate depolymerase
MSNGGFMSYELACSLSNRITAVASVTGAMPSNRLNTCAPARKVPALQIHGTNDLVVPIGGNLQYASISEVVGFWVDQNEVSNSPVSSSLPDVNQNDNSTVEWMRYYYGNGKTAVEFYRVQNGGHTWPGAIVSLPNDVTNRDFHASTEIWRFFQQHTLNDNNTTGQEVLSSLGKSVLVFPNPSDGKVLISSPFNIEKIQVLDVLGNLIVEEEMASKEFHFQTEKKGIYIAQIYSHNRWFIKKFVIH